MVLEITDQNYEKEVLRSTTPIIVDFWASWCGPCKMQAPAFEELSKEYTGKLKFAKLSTEDYPEFGAQNDITGIPCLIVFSKGQEVDRIIGFHPKPMLKVKIDAILKVI